MGLFNLKKSKSNDDEFEASDAWLMGLADDDEFGSFPDGPNSSIPAGLASLAPTDVEQDDPAFVGDDAHRGYGFSGHDFTSAVAGEDPIDTGTQDLLDSENVDLSSWHFPDLCDTEPVSSSPAAPHPQPNPLEPSPGILPIFDARHRGGTAFDEYGDDSIVHDPLVADEAGATDDPGFLSAAPTAEGMGFGSELFASALDGGEIAAARIDHAHSFETSAPRGREADLLCEILGVEPGAPWSEVRAAHAAAMSEYDPRLESDQDRIDLAWAIRREMNSTYATLRLLAAS